MNPQNVKEVVREKYGQAARRVQAGAGKACSYGGRFAVFDVVVRGHVPTEIKQSLEL
jgi:hypothetical protein